MAEIPAGFTRFDGLPLPAAQSCLCSYTWGLDGRPVRNGPVASCQALHPEDVTVTVNGGEPVPGERGQALPPRDVNSKAAEFAAAHGSFSLFFDAAQNYVKPDDCPWALVLDGEEHGWGGFTAEEAIDFAAAELGKAEGADGG